MPCRRCYECWRRKLDKCRCRRHDPSCLITYSRPFCCSMLVQLIRMCAVASEILCSIRKMSSICHRKLNKPIDDYRHLIELRIYLFSETCGCCGVCTLCKSGRYESTNDDGRSLYRCVEYGRRDALVSFNVIFRCRN